MVIECKRVRGVDPPWCYYLKVEAPEVSDRSLIGRSFGKPATLEDTKEWIRAAVEFIEQRKLYQTIISEAADKAEAKIKELDNPPIPKGGSYRAHLMALELDRARQRDSIDQ